MSYTQRTYSAFRHNRFPKRLMTSNFVKDIYFSWYQPMFLYYNIRRFNTVDYVFDNFYTLKITRIL